MRPPRLIAVGVAGLALVAGTASVASAATRPAHRPRPLALAAGPVRQQVTGIDGRRVAVHFLLGNPGRDPIAVTAREESFRQLSNGTMTPATPPPGEAGWLQLPKGKIIIPPGYAGIHVTGWLALPRHAQPGDADLAAAFTAVAAHLPAKTGAVIAPSVYAEVIAVVPGKASRRLVWHLAGGGLSFGGPVALTATVAERGSDYDLLNALWLAGPSADVRLPGVLLLAGSTRTMAASWQPPEWGCLTGCTVRFGSASVTVWSLPVLPIGGFLLILAGAGTIAWWLRRNHAKAAARRHGPKPSSSPHAAAHIRLGR